MLTALAANLIGAALQHPVIDTQLLQHFLTRLVGLVALTILGAFMCCLVIAGLLFGLYDLLVFYGLLPGVALVIVLAIAMLITGIIVAVTMRRLQQLRDLSLMPKRDMRQQDMTGGIIRAFLDGFTNARPMRGR